MHRNSTQLAKFITRRMAMWLSRKLIFLVLISLFFICTTVYAASPLWTQTDWSGGYSQTSWKDSAKFSLFSVVGNPLIATSNTATNMATALNITSNNNLLRNSSFASERSGKPRQRNYQLDSTSGNTLSYASTAENRSWLLLKNKVHERTNVSGGRSVDLLNISSGKGVVRSIQVIIGTDAANPDYNTLYSKLNFYIDGEQTPSSSPLLVDFFSAEDLLQIAETVPSGNQTELE